MTMIAETYKGGPVGVERSPHGSPSRATLSDVVEPF